jgi:hypothetical protein
MDVFKQPKYPLKIVSKYFGKGSSAKLAQELMLDDKALYDDMRRSAQDEHGLIGSRGYFRPQDAPVGNAREYSDMSHVSTRVKHYVILCDY